MFQSGLAIFSRRGRRERWPISHLRVAKETAPAPPGGGGGTCAGAIEGDCGLTVKTLMPVIATCSRFKGRPDFAVPKEAAPAGGLSRDRSRIGTQPQGRRGTRPFQQFRRGRVPSGLFCFREWPISASTWKMAMACFDP
jgi:hypothetical protein